MCCGEPAKRLGEEGRFQTIALTNMEVLREAAVQKIVTHCPHCLNVLRYDYGSLGFDVEVLHHSALLANLLAESRLPAAVSRAAGPSGLADRSVVYHEPCNLARGTAADASPGAALLAGALLPDRSGRRTFCCGGGGANMWYTVERETARISHLRLQELMDSGASRIATSCPFCLSMLTDAMGSLEAENRPVMDISEILAERLVK
jgi:Fe-S oxidoreductase